MVCQIFSPFVQDVNFVSFNDGVGGVSRLCMHIIVVKIVSCWL
jgi:hypothetical protein